MKTKILCLVAVIVALVATCSITAFANNEQTNTPEIISQNIEYGEKFSLMYAVDASTVAEGAVTLNIYSAYPNENAVPRATYKSEAPQSETIHDETVAVYVFITAGIAPADMADVFYAQAIDSQGNKSAVVKYSVAEYMYEMLYKNGDSITPKQERLYKASLEIGAAAQDLLREGETLVSDYKYIMGGENILVNGYSADVIPVGEAFTVTYNGATAPTGYNVRGFDGSVKDVATNYSFIVEDHAAIYPSFAMTFDAPDAATLVSNSILKITKPTYTGTDDPTKTNSVNIEDSTLVFNHNAYEFGAAVKGAAAGSTFVYETKFMMGTDFTYTRTDGQGMLQTSVYVSSSGSTDWYTPIVNVVYDAETQAPKLAIGEFTTAFELGKWYQIRVEYLGTTAGSEYNFYLDNQKVYTGTLSQKIYTNADSISYYSPWNCTGTFHFDNMYIGEIPNN